VKLKKDNGDGGFAYRPHRIHRGACAKRKKRYACMGGGRSNRPRSCQREFHNIRAMRGRSNFVAEYSAEEPSFREKGTLIARKRKHLVTYEEP